MAHTFNEDEIFAQAPDESSLKAAKGLLGLSGWSGLGQNDEAIWGACQGSGSKPYLTQMHVIDRVYKCTCPSRKFPCKHSLALALIYCDNVSAFSSVEVPTWVNEWLSGRQQRAEKKAVKESDQVLVELTPEALEKKAAKQAKQQAQKQGRIQDGLDELQLWLLDLIRSGIAPLGQQRQQIKLLASRMVDAQLPGVARRLNDLAAIAGLDGDYPLQVLRGLGQLQLMIEAYIHIANLSITEQADILEALGANKEPQLAETLTDDWRVLGVSFTEDNKLWQRSVWLQGHHTRRYAYLLDYQYGSRSFEPWLSMGQALSGNVSYFTSNCPLRGKLQITAAATTTATVQAYALSTLLTYNAQQLAANPWRNVQPWFIAAARIVYHEPDQFSLIVENQIMPLALTSADGWQLLATLGNDTADVFAEYNQAQLMPMSVWCQGQLVWQNWSLTV